MSDSPLQDSFLRVFAISHKATTQRMSRRISELGIDTDTMAKTESILADEGMIHIVDEDGIAFDSCMHEICLPHYDKA